MNAAGTRPQYTNRPRQTGLIALVVALLVLVLSGCGLRLETPPPTEPVPDALEVARRAAAADVIAILDVAAQALESLPEGDPSIGILDEIMTASTVHLHELGGEYDSGLDEDDGSPSASPSAPVGSEKASLDDVVDRLAQAYSRTRGALESIPKPGLARLMASVATFQLTSARSLAASSELELPTVVVPGTPRMPEDPPSGISASDLTPLILSEDAAGYAYEVLAARLLDAPRVAAQARASVHRSRADSAAEAAHVARTVQDPRRVAYDLPPDPTDEAFVRGLELELADSYASLVALAGEDDRVVFFDLLIDSYHSALTWGADPVTFPGLPEQTEAKN